MQMSKNFDSIRKELEVFENHREKVIQQSREIITISKKLIYAVQRGDFATAKAAQAELKKKIKLLPEEAYDTEIQKVALQEYVEALTFYGLLANKKLPTKEELHVDAESYLLGLADLTGELVREAVNSSIKGNSKKALEIKDFVTELYGQFLLLDLRNGELRKRVDSIKWNLRKLEDLALSWTFQKQL